MSISPCHTAQENTCFSSFSLHDADRYTDLFKTAPAQPIAYSLPNLWGWLPWMQLETYYTDELCWLRCSSNGHKNFAPIGNWSAINWTEIQDYLLKISTIYTVPQSLLTIWQEKLNCKIEAIENRDYWEYVYNTEDLANMAGSKYHMQRNHINSYIKANGEPDYRTLSQAQTKEMLALNEEWYQTNITQSTTAERDALHRVLENWQTIAGLIAGGIYLKNELIAFSIGYKLNNSTLGVLYEKGKPGLRGAFPVMTRSFARNAGAGYDFLNRAEDMGDEGMRKAKMLYRPIKFEQLYTVNFS